MSIRSLKRGLNQSIVWLEWINQITTLIPTVVSDLIYVRWRGSYELHYNNYCRRLLELWTACPHYVCSLYVSNHWLYLFSTCCFQMLVSRLVSYSLSMLCQVLWFVTKWIYHITPRYQEFRFWICFRYMYWRLMIYKYIYIWMFIGFWNVHLEFSF